MALTGARRLTVTGGIAAAAVAPLGLGWGLGAAIAVLGIGVAWLPAGRRLATPLLAFAALGVVWAAARF